jgi:hypothetical protein
VAEADFDAVRKWVAMLPNSLERAKADYERQRGLTIAERLAVFDALHRDAVRLLGGRPPLRDPSGDLRWHRWRDPAYGR